MKESTRRIIRILETTNLTLEQIGGQFGKTKQNISYIKRKYNVIRPTKIDDKEKEGKGIKELKEISDLIKKEINEKEILNERDEKKERNESEKENDEISKVLIVCPICKVSKKVDIPKNIINESKQITTVNINSNLVCSHFFQVFIDKNFVVRGYQRNDYEIKQKEEEKKVKTDLEERKLDRVKNIQSGLEQLRSIRTIEKEEEIKEKEIIENKEMTDKEIYEEFWELIDDNNEEFKEFIINDERRRQKEEEIVRNKGKEEKIERKKKEENEFDKEKILQEYYFKELEKTVKFLYRKEQEGKIEDI